MDKWNKEKIIEKLLNLSKELKRRPTRYCNSNLYFLSRKYFGSWNNLMKSAGYKVKERQKPKIPNLNSKLFYYFLGLLLTDGHIVSDIKNQKYKIILFTSFKEEKDLIIDIIKKLFDYNASIRKRRWSFAKRINYEIYISSKKLCKLFVQKIKIPSGAKSLTLKIPSFIMKGKKSNLWPFIRGIIDGDGSIIKTNKSSVLKIASGSGRFIKNLNKLMIKLGFRFGKVRHENKNLWILRFTRVEDIKRMYFLVYDNCGSYHYKRKKLVWRQYI